VVTYVRISLEIAHYPACRMSVCPFVLKGAGILPPP
jgi:hypothetical protein